jgi:hypothetical protein
MLVIYWNFAGRWGSQMYYSEGIYGFPFECNESVWLIPGTFE